MELKIDKSTWKKVRLEDVAFEYSKRINNPSESEFDRFVGSSNIGQWDFRVNSWESTKSVSSAMKLFEPNDYLLVRRSLYASDFRERAPRANFHGVCSGDILTIRENPEFVADGFLIGVFNNSDLWKYVVANASGSITRRIKWRDLANYEFLLPPKEEQKKLAELLWAIDDVIDKERKLLKDLNSTYLSIIEKELIDSTQKKIFLSEMGIIVRGVGYKPEDLLEKVDLNSCIILRSNNISNGKINYDDIRILPKMKVRETQILKIDDFAVCMSNGSKDLVGKASRFYGFNVDVAVGSFCAGFRPKNKEFSDVLQHLFASENYRQKIKRTLSGSAINNLKPSDIEEIFFRFDWSSSKTKETIGKLNHINDSRMYIENKIRSSLSLQKSLINQIF